MDPSHGRAKAGWPTRTYIQQHCEDTGCSPEDLPEAMNDREEWWERVGDICAGRMTRWWWWTISNEFNFHEDIHTHSLVSDYVNLSISNREYVFSIRSQKLFSFSYEMFKYFLVLQLAASLLCREVASQWVLNNFGFVSEWYERIKEYNIFSRRN